VRGLAIPLLIVAGCSDAPAGGSGAAVALPVGQSADVSPCTRRASADTYLDERGWHWSFDRTGWCRRSPDGASIERWITGPAQAPTHLLHIEGRRAFLTRSIRLFPVRNASAAAAPGCRGTPRLDLFHRRNWLRLPGDLECAVFRGDGLHLRTEAYQDDGPPIPALISTPDGEARGTVIMLRGGPYRSVIRGLAASALTSHILDRHGRSAVISIPAYIGTDPVRYGQGDLGRAQDELRRVLRAHPASAGPVCVIAASLGAFAVAPLAAEHPSVSFLLVSPLVSSAENFVERARRAGVPAPLRELVETGDGRTRTVRIREDEAYLQYFGDLRRQTLAERLAPAAVANNWHILYSTADVAIGQEAAAQLRTRFGPARVTTVAQAGHAVEDAFNFQAYRAGIDAFLNHCLSGSADGARADG
jgi:hypothetical protein